MTVYEEVREERERQITKEGFSSSHDDDHEGGSLAKAAATYAFASTITHINSKNAFAQKWWPWEWRWWKPKDPRRDLIRAAALIVAEIERLDRIAAIEALDAETEPGTKKDDL